MRELWHLQFVQFIDRSKVTLKIGDHLLAMYKKQVKIISRRMAQIDTPRYSA